MNSTHYNPQITIPQTELERLLLTAINATLNAGELIMEVYNSDDFQVNLKSDATPLTLADRKAHDEILSHLLKTRIPVMSEEGRDLHFDERKGWEYFWLVDPLDGTKEFIKRNGEFTVNIALVFEGYPIMGVIYVPVLKQLYFAMQNLGSFRVDNIKQQHEPLESIDHFVTDQNRLPFPAKDRPFTITTSRSHPTDETLRFIDQMRKTHPNLEVIARGSSLKICMVAEGNADLYPRYGATTEWDIAAGQAIAEMAGYEIVSIDTDERLYYNKENIENPWFMVQKKRKI